MRDLSNLISAVALNASIAASAVQALIAAEQHNADLTAQLAAMRQQFDAGAVDPAQLTKLLDTVSTTTSQLSAAIPANATDAGVPAVPVVSASPVIAPDTAMQARDAAAAAVPAVGTTAPSAPGAFAQPTEAATAGLAAGPGPVVTPQA